MTTAALPDGRVPVPLSAHADELLSQDADAILRYLDGHADAPVRDIAQTLLRTRRSRRHRAVVRAADRSELIEALAALADGGEHPLLTRAAGHLQHPRIAFIFPGQGSQWPAMGVEADQRLPQYRAEVDTCVAAFVAAGAASPLDYLLADSGADTNDFGQVQIQGAQFVHGVALACVWRAHGVLPDITVGHSLGEIGAAYVAGSITLEHAVAVVIARATVLDSLTGPYRVAVLGVTPDEAEAVVAETPGWLEVSVVNSRSSVAVSGETEAVATAVRTVTGRGAFAKEIEMWFPAHTTALDSVHDELESLLPTGQFAEAPVQFIGSTTAGAVTAGTDFAEYWYANLRGTVRFDRAVTTAARRGARIFIELSAHPALLFAMADQLDDAAELAGGPVVMVGTGRRDEPLTDRISANIAAVALADPSYRWADQLGGAPTSLRDFPFAPMHAAHHWARPDPLPPVAALTVAGERWQQTAVPPAAGTHRVAVIDLGSDVAATLRTSFESHAGVVPAEPGDADLLVVVAPAISPTDVVAAAGELSRRIGTGLLNYADAVTAATREVWLVTSGAEQIDEEDRPPLPAAAALAAMHRSVGLEFPDQAFRHVDVAEELGAVEAALTVTAVLSGLSDIDRIAVRRKGLGAIVLGRSMVAETSVVPSWAADPGALDEVVITGGAGVVGRHFARELAALGARRIVLLSRSGLGAEQLAELGGRYDVEIVAPRCDLTDADQVSAVAQEFGGSGAGLVIHAAASAHLAQARELTSAAASETFGAKVTGIVNLMATWPLRTDTRTVMCSSVSGLWGGHGHAAYAAANRLLDVLAAQLRAQGRHCTAIRWGLWQGAGIVDAGEVEKIERSGLRPMTPDRAVEAALREYPGDPLVFTADAERLGRFLGEYLRTHQKPQARAERHRDQGLSARADAAGTDSTAAVRIALGSVLKLEDTSGLDLDASLLDLGVDSLLALDLRKNLKKATGRSVPLATILGGVSATELIEHLQKPEKEAFSRD